MNYLEHLEQTLQRNEFVMSIRATTNWCHSNLMAISRQRLANIAMQRDVNYEKGNEIEEIPTIDTQVGEEIHEEQDLELNTTFHGGERKKTLTERGNLFASIRHACFEIATANNWVDYDKPRNIKEYMDQRIENASKRVPTKTEIHNGMALVKGMSMLEVQESLQRGIDKQIGQLVDNKLNIIAEDSRYEDDIDAEDALHDLGLYQQLRLRVAIMNSFMAAYIGKGKTALMYPGGALAQQLLADREFIFADLKLMREEYNKFLKDNEVAIKKDAEERPLPEMLPEYQRIIMIVEKQEVEEREIRKEIIHEKMIAEEQARVDKKLRRTA